MRHVNCIFYAPYYIVVCALTGSTTHFPQLPHKRKEYREKSFIGYKMRILFSLQLLPETCLFPREIQCDIVNLCRSSCKVPMILVKF
jgi:hypothetical protein